MKMFQSAYSKRQTILWGGVSVFAFFFLWQAGSGLGFINPDLFPSPIAVGTAIIDAFSAGSLWNDILNSVRRVLIGFCIGGSSGLVLGLLCSFVNKIGYIIKPLIELVRPIPPIAWIPISILWFGFGEPAAYFLISFGAFFPIFSSTFLGISQVSKGTVEVAQCHGAGGDRLFWEIILPQAFPSIFSGVRTALGISWMIVITAELVGVQSGLGYFIQVSRAQLQTDNVLAGMVVIGFIGLLLTQALKIVSNWLMPWRSRAQKIGYDE